MHFATNGKLTLHCPATYSSSRKTEHHLSGRGLESLTPCVRSCTTSSGRVAPNMSSILIIQTLNQISPATIITLSQAVPIVDIHFSGLAVGGIPLSTSAITKFMHITITVPISELGKGKRLNRYFPCHCYWESYFENYLRPYWCF